MDTYSVRKMLLHGSVQKLFTGVIGIHEQLVEYRDLSLGVFTFGSLVAWRTRIYLPKKNFSMGLSWRSPPLFPGSKSTLQIKLMSKKIKV